MTTKRAKGRVSWITQRRLSEARNATDTCVLVRLWGFPGMWAGTGTGFSGHLFFLHITLPLLNLLGFLRRHMNGDKCTGRKESAGVRSPGKRNPQIHVVSLLSFFRFRPLHLACISGSVDVVAALIRMAPHPCLLNIQNDVAQTPLHLAALTAQPNIMRILLLAGAEVIFNKDRIRRFRYLQICKI